MQHLHDVAGGVHRVERAVGAHGGLADLLQRWTDPAGLQVERDHVALLVQQEDDPLIGVGSEGALERRELVRELPRGRLQRGHAVQSHLAAAPGDAEHRRSFESSADRRQVACGGEIRLASAPGQDRRQCRGGDCVSEGHGRNIGR
jgi:hypothetical protein